VTHSFATLPPLFLHFPFPPSSKVADEHHRVMTLNSFLLFHGIEGEAKWKLMECARVIYTVRDLFLHMGRVMMTMSPRNIERRRSLPESLRDVDTFRTDTENVHEHDDKRLTSFQHAFLYLRKVLEGQA